MTLRSEEDKRKLAAELVSFLNELLAVDESAVYSLMETRVICNEAMLNHPTVQVATDEADVPVVGILGILNGFVGVDEESYGYIEAVYDEGCHKLHHFVAR